MQILFKLESKISQNLIIEVFQILKINKSNNEYCYKEIKQLLGEIYFNKFWHPTDLELKQWGKDWFSTPFKERLTKESLKKPWNFESWIDSIITSELEYISLLFENDIGFMNIKKITDPSGGLDATEELIKIFDGKIISIE